MAKTFLNGIKVTRAFIGGIEISKLYKEGQLVFGVESHYQPETLAIIQKANSSGYSLPSDITHIDNLIISMKAVGVWDKLDVFHLFAGDGSNDFKRINLIDPSRSLGVFGGAMLINNKGIKGNGIDAYFNSNFNPSTAFTGKKLTQNNSSKFYVVNEETTGTANSKALLGGISVVGNDTFYNMNIDKQRLFSFNSPLSSTFDMSGLGLKAITRTSASNIILTSGATTGTRTQGASGIRSSNMQVLRGYEETPSSFVYGDAGLTCWGMGASISAQEYQDFRISINTYLTAIGETPIA